MPNVALTQEKFSEDRYDEIWVVKLNTGGEYELSKVQATILQQEIASGNRGIILFKTFSISIPYIAEFYMRKRFLKDSLQLPATASETPYEPISSERWEELKKTLYKKLSIK